MARDYAQIVTSIWRDPEFCARSVGAQRTYLMLFSQPEITAAGVLPLTVSRWSRTLREDERDHLAGWLNELVDHGYIVIDAATEELLVRSFIKWDKGYRNSKRQPVIREAMTIVVSPKIRSVLASECDRLDFDPGDAYAQVNRVSDALSDRASDGITRFDRVVVTEVGSNHNPQPTTHNPGPLATDTERPTSIPVKQNAAKLTREYASKIPACNFGYVATAIELALMAGDYPESEIVAAVHRLADRPDIGLSQTSLRIEIEQKRRPRGRDRPEPAGTTEARNALARAAQYAAEADTADQPTRRQIGAGA